MILKYTIGNIKRNIGVGFNLNKSGRKIKKIM